MNNLNQQEKKKYTNSREFASKMRFSLAMKLNLHLFVSTLSLLLFINLFLCMMVLFSTLWQAEKSTVLLVESHSPKTEVITNEWKSETLGFTISPTAKNEKGLNLWKGIHKNTPLKDYDVQRSMSFHKEEPVNSHHLSTLEYHMIFSNQNFTITYSIGAALSNYISILYLLLILEALLLLSNTHKGAKNIRNILRPLSDMTQRAQNLTAISGGAIPAEEMKHLRELAGTISSIDATKLDKRLPVDGPQNELKDLASAINNMLNRIDEAYRSQVRFVSDASHELRTPIAVVQGYANLLDRWGKNDQVTMQEAIDAIKSEADSMKDLIEQLLFLARGDNETLQLYPETFHISEIVEEILRETKMIDSLHTLHAKVQSPALIHADRQLMKQALRILVDNSIKYTPTGGEIVVSVTAENQLVHISVQDNGIGIEPQTLPYIFDRFYRSDESRARKTGGSGLGLSIMKWIVDRHGGTIEVISRKDIGTRTTILLPQVFQA